MYIEFKWWTWSTQMLMSNNIKFNLYTNIFNIYIFKFLYNEIHNAVSKYLIFIVINVWRNINRRISKYQLINAYTNKLVSSMALGHSNLQIQRVREREGEWGRSYMRIIYINISEKVSSQLKVILHIQHIIKCVIIVVGRHIIIIFTVVVVGIVFKTSSYISLGNSLY